MATFKEKAKLVLKDSLLRKKILFVLAGLFVFRLFAAIPVPGVDVVRLKAFLAQNQFFGFLDILSGSGFSNLSIVMLGVGPYITASIIMQLLTMMSPKMKSMYQEEGEAGRARFAQYSRRLSIPLAVIQAYSFLVILSQQGLLTALTPMQLAVNVVVISAGSVFLMWLGELITEYGIGNGVSMIIFAGIVATLPQKFPQIATLLETDPARIPTYILYAIIAVIALWVVVIITEAERSVPVTYAKQVRGANVTGGMSTYLPLRLNQAGVIPIIFALSIMTLPQLALQALRGLTQFPKVADIAGTLFSYINPQSIWYLIAYFILVFLFTYVYTAVTFDPQTISTNLQKGGAFIPGVRPGQSTAMFLAKIVTRITLVGALFLAIIAVLPLVIQAIEGSTTSFAIGGTALLIAVTAVIDLIKKIEGQLSMREY